ncbi:conserved hypothetical protein [Ricinus communis]|uniref:Uncharacterized protein n=1 Tax=Ricinus communis TaxID=3988 RepID=B9RJC1_RICCO|nr:conserved hypothetical protein [Ricinus communis]
MRLLAYLPSELLVSASAEDNSSSSFGFKENLTITKRTAREMKEQLQIYCFSSQNIKQYFRGGD